MLWDRLPALAATLRNRHESTVLNLTEAVRYQQWQEARHAKAFSGRSPTRVHRYTYYELLLGNTAEVIVIPELDALDSGGLAARRFRQQEPDLTQRPFGTSVVADVQSSGGGRKLSAQEVEELSLLLQLLTSQHGRDYRSHRPAPSIVGPHHPT